MHSLADAFVDYFRFRTLVSYYQKRYDGLEIDIEKELQLYKVKNCKDFQFK